MSSIDWNRPIPNTCLEKAVKNLRFLIGEQAGEGLVHVLERKGIIFDGRTEYPLTSLREVIVSIFGEDGSSPIVFSVWRDLRKENFWTSTNM